MPEEIFIGIDGNALYAKSQVYIRRALAKKGSSDSDEEGQGCRDEYILCASIALELLGKSALAQWHPSLIVDSNDWKSMFVAAGIKVTTDVRTITANVLFERLVQLIPLYDKTIQEFCISTAKRRNAELHSAEFPFQTLQPDAMKDWERHYWHACDTILQHMNYSLEEWLGAAEANAPRQLLREAAIALQEAIKQRVMKAEKHFRDMKKADRDRLASDAKDQRIPDFSAFTGIYDEIWREECPACKCWAFMGGDQFGEEISEERHKESMWELVDREFFCSELRCSACGLTLIGSGEIDAAGLFASHFEQHEREMEYEPDYGTD